MDMCSKSRVVLCSGVHLHEKVDLHGKVVLNVR